jgi:hypothetical protein
MRLMSIKGEMQRLCKVVFSNQNNEMNCKKGKMKEWRA